MMEPMCIRGILNAYSIYIKFHYWIGVMSEKNYSKSLQTIFNRVSQNFGTHCMCMTFMLLARHLETSL